MRVVLDIEANRLEKPDKIWCIVCKDIDTKEVKVFRNVHENKEDFYVYIKQADTLIGHHILGYDVPVLRVLLPDVVLPGHCVDTLIISKMVDYSRDGHSIEDYGVEFGIPKGKNHYLDFFKQWSQPLEDYCVRDVEIAERIYHKYKRFINNPAYARCIRVEHDFQSVVNELHDNGFAFNSDKASKILSKVEAELRILDSAILSEFPPRTKLIRCITPEVTKHGTLNKKDFKWVKDGDLTEFNGGPFCRFSYVPFNPASHKQIIDVLTDAGWSPVDKTKTYLDTERTYNKLKYQRNKSESLDLEMQECHSRLQELAKYGWKINEFNLLTLPPTAPAPAKSLAKRILLESRRRTLTEWLSLVSEDNRIHGKFYGIGAWTQRMAHQEPNTANIPNEFDTQGNKKLFGKEMRSCWMAPKNRLLVGCDAEGIQLRIFAHYINDQEFIDALVRGRKEDKSDPHSLNQRVLGEVCRSRAAAKRFIYALLLGAGIGKLAEILDCGEGVAREALERLMERYNGFKTLKETIIPADAKRGWFIGLDGRPVSILGESVGAKRHLAMSGYLQNGEAVVMKHATLKWLPEVKELGGKIVDFVHDEWQVEVPNDMKIALRVAELMADSLRIVGEELNLKCPLAGSYWNDDLKDYTIGINWSFTH